MATEQPWELIRRAADHLEKLASEATPGPWEVEYNLRGGPQAVFQMDPEYPDDPDFSRGLGCMDAPSDNAWVATLSPPVAVPLVAWLRESAVPDTETSYMEDWHTSPAWQFAQLILKEQA